MKNTNILNQIPRTINDIVTNALNDSFYGIPCPAKIISYNYTQRTASIQWLVQISDGNGGFIENPVIPNVPVVSHSTSKGIISLKIQVVWRHCNNNPQSELKTGTLMVVFKTNTYQQKAVFKTAFSFLQVLDKLMGNSIY